MSRLRRSTAYCLVHCRSFPEQLVEPRHLAAPVDPVVGRATSVHRDHATAASGLRRRSVAGQRRDLRLPLRRRGRHAAEEGRGVRLLRRERRRESHDRIRAFPFYPIPDEAITQPHWIEGGEPGNVDLRSDSDRHLLIVDRDNRHLYELYNVFFDGTQLARRLRRLLRPEHQRPAARALDVGRCRGPGDPSRPRALRRGVRPRRDRARVPRDRARDQRLRLSGVASRRLHDRRAADGRAAASEGEQGPVRASGRSCRRFSARCSATA